MRPAGEAPALPERLVAALAAAGLAVDVTPAPALPDRVAGALAQLADPLQRPAGADPVSPEVGRLLYELALATRRRRALELGTSTGAAALWLGAAMAVTGGRLETIERDSARAKLATRHLREAGLDERVTLRLGDAARLIPRLTSSCDLVLFDEAPDQREAHFLALLPRLSRGALLCSHGGRTQPAELARFHAQLRAHPAVRANATVAVGDGLEVAVVGKTAAPRPA